MFFDQVRSEQLPNSIRTGFQQFPEQMLLSLPEESEAPRFTGGDYTRFGVIIIQQGKEAQTYFVRENRVGETIKTIDETSLIYFTPILEVEDPDSSTARSRGGYYVSCKGWKEHQGKAGNKDLREGLESIVKTCSL
jgi:hypothetical protein